MAEGSLWILETTTERFEQDVMVRSHQVPVVVDFWAAWCHPCRLLSPVLEKLTREYQGAFVLVKADVDRMPDVAAAFEVQMIPAVFAIRNGQVVSYFTGVATEEQIRDWLSQLLPTQTEQRLVEAQALEESDPAAAEAQYRQILAGTPNEIAAQIGLARCLLAQDRMEEAEKLLEPLSESGLLNREGERIQAQIAVRRWAQEVGNLSDAQAAAQAHPDDPAYQFHLAQAYAVAQEYEKAMQQALELLQRDRAQWAEPCRKLMVHLFHLLGDDHPLVAPYRRKLAMALY